MALHSPLQCPPAELEAVVGPTVRRKLYASYRDGKNPLCLSHSPLGARAHTQVLQAFEAGLPSVGSMTRAPDGTCKLATQLEDGEQVETVLIPEKRRTTICLSSQVGCARGCIFCSTGTMGLGRNLRADEITAQLVLGIRVQQDEELPPITNAVYMGMGEPLDNLAAVQDSVETLAATEAFGFRRNRITVSTVGPSPSKILRLRALDCAIAWSAHSTREDVRQHLVPTARHSFQELLAAFEQVFRARSSRNVLFVEATLIQGLNDSVEDAAHMAHAFQGFPVEVRFNLIPMNAVPHARDLLPSERAHTFQRVLREAGYRCFLRHRRGAENASACGQLITGLPGTTGGSPGKRGQHAGRV